MRLSHLVVVGFASALLISTAFGQVLPKNRPRSVTPGLAPTPGEKAGETRREGRQEARDARADAKNAGETRPEARETARDTRQQTRADIQANRAADYGVWLNTRGNNLVIDDLTNKGMFASAGFRTGDQIVSINGSPVTTEAQFVQSLSAPNLSGPIEIVVMRNGQRQPLVLQATALSQGMATYDPFYQYGIVVDGTRPDQIIVQRVYPRTPAYYAGLRQGDVITTLGGQRIASVNAFSQALRGANAAVDLAVTRSGQSRQIQLDGSSINAAGSVRTALRPNVDAEVNAGTRTDIRSDSAPAERTTDSPRAPDATPSRRPDANDARPTEPLDRASRPTPPSGSTPAVPAAPATPGVSPAAPATPAVPNVPQRDPSPAPAPGASGTTPIPN